MMTGQELSKKGRRRRRSRIYTAKRRGTKSDPELDLTQPSEASKTSNPVPNFDLNTMITPKKSHGDSSTKDQPKMAAPTKPTFADVAKREFPSLSNTSQMGPGTPSNLWSATTGRNIGQMQRGQQTPLTHSNHQQDEYFGNAARLTSNQQQGSFRFGGQGSAGQAVQNQPAAADDFPPLNTNNMRSTGGEMSQERGSNLMSTLGFGAHSGGSSNMATSSMGAGRAGNGLLNALSATNRAQDVQSPDPPGAPGSTRHQDVRSLLGADEPRQKPPGFRGDGMVAQQSGAAQQEGTTPGSDARNPHGAIGNDAPGRAKDEKDVSGPAAHDPLAGLAPVDKWGLKGFRMLMNNYPAYNMGVTGFDPREFNLNLQSSEPILRNNTLSMLDDAPPRPVIPKFTLPECYNVTNVQPLKNKVPHFNEETLLMMFYDSPGEEAQILAAQELNVRNWRWHKKLQLWLTKDELMQPRTINSTSEQGYYIIWEPTLWRKERRELILQYADLETLNVNNGATGYAGNNPV